MFKFKKIEKRLILKSITESLAYLNQKQKTKTKQKKPPSTYHDKYERTWFLLGETE